MWGGDAGGINVEDCLIVSGRFGRRRDAEGSGGGPCWDSQGSLVGAWLCVSGRLCELVDGRMGGSVGMGCGVGCSVVGGLRVEDSFLGVGL
jgi:hypothetical protein